MSRFIVEDNRLQAILFPERLDEYIGEDNPVRVIDAFVDGLDFQQLDFERAVPKATGRPGYSQISRRLQIFARTTVRLSSKCAGSL